MHNPHVRDDGGVTVEFSQFMLELAEAFRTTITEGAIRQYAATLGDFPLAAVRTAGNRAVMERRVFPTVAELRQILAASPEDAALLAWTALGQAAEDIGAYSTIAVEDACAAEALTLVFGSWPAFCAMEEGPETALKRQEFLAAYRQARLHHGAPGPIQGRRCTPQRLPGLCEASGDYPDGPTARRVWIGLVRQDGRVQYERDAARALPPAPKALDIAPEEED